LMTGVMLARCFLP